MSATADSITAYADGLKRNYINRDTDAVAVLGDYVSVQFKSCGLVVISLLVSADGSFSIGQTTNCHNARCVDLWALAWSRASGFINSNELRAMS